jgi:hypothetical protein
VKHRLAFLTALAAVSIGAVACSSAGVDNRAFQWTDQLPAGSVVHLRDGAGDITVRRGTGPSALVVGSRRWRHGRPSDVRFVVRQDGKDYYVCAMWRGSGKCGASGYRGRQTGSLLTMFSLFHRNSDARADLVAEFPPDVVVDASSTNGSVEVNGMVAGVTARTVNGTVDASNVSGPLVLSTTNGNIRLSADSLADADVVRLSTTNGMIHAELPAGLQGNFDLSTVNGAVSSDFPIPAASAGRATHHLQGQVGSLSRLVKMRTINGPVTVSARGAPATH